MSEYSLFSHWVLSMCSFPFTFFVDYFFSFIKCSLILKKYINIVWIGKVKIVITFSKQFESTHTHTVMQRFDELKKAFENWKTCELDNLNSHWQMMWNGCGWSRVLVCARVCLWVCICESVVHVRKEHLSAIVQMLAIVVVVVIIGNIDCGVSLSGSQTKG